MKIAIMGFGPTQEQAPWQDSSWELWGLPWCKRWREYDRYFEMHSKHVLSLENASVLKEFWDGEQVVTNRQRSEDYIGRLWEIAGDKDKILYVQEPLEGAVVYPYEKVICWTRDYFTSSPAYMIALAIALIQEDGDEDGPNTIGLWGIDLLDDQEWFYQRANLEYLLGKAEGMGIRIRIPGGSRLFAFPDHSISFGGVMIKYSKRYGMLGKEPQEFKRRAMPPHLFNGVMERFCETESAEKLIKQMRD